MRNIWLALGALWAPGCAFSPPGAYPIFEPDPATFALFNANVDFDCPTNRCKESRGMLLSLQAQSAAYNGKADHARRGIYHQNDWTTAGVGVGIAGGLIESVATAVTGAVIGGGATIVGARYKQGDQVSIYRTAAKKINCLWITTANSMNSEYYAITNQEVRMAYRQPITQGANYAAMEILAELRSQLDTLMPAPVDVQAVMSQITQNRLLHAKYSKALEALQQAIPPAKTIQIALRDATPESKTTALAVNAARTAAAIVVANLQLCVKVGRPVTSGFSEEAK